MHPFTGAGIDGLLSFLFMSGFVASADVITSARLHNVRAASADVITSARLHNVLTLLTHVDVTHHAAVLHRR